MAAKKKSKVSFEAGMAALEAMIVDMQKGDLSLDEMMSTYETGMALVGQLDAMLKEHKRRIEKIDLDTAEITAFEEDEHGVS